MHAAAAARATQQIGPEKRVPFEPRSQNLIAERHSLLSRYCWVDPNVGGFLRVVR